MPSQIKWLPDAARDVARLRGLIEKKNPTAAKRAADRIKEGALMLMDNPEAGRPVTGLIGFREIMVPFGAGNYILRYQEDGTTVIIVRVRHNREDRN
jgi:plasmid stabilization system protein ParE